jgi:hypothetical protein
MSDSTSENAIIPENDLKERTTQQIPFSTK